MPDIDVVLFVEDPGAANFAAPLYDDLVRGGYRVRWFAAGSAISHLASRTRAPEAFPGAGFVLPGSSRLLIVGTSENPDTPAFSLVAQARRGGIPTAGLVDSPANAAHRFRGRSDSPLAHAPDHLLVPDEGTAGLFRALGHPPDRIHVTGHPHYDVVRAERRRLDAQGRFAVRRKVFPRLPEERLVVVFIAEVRGGLDEEQYRRSEEFTLTGSGRTPWRSEIVLEEFLFACERLPVRPYTVLRLPPKGSEDDFQGFLPAFDEVRHREPIFPLLYAADLVVGMTSMPLVEAALLGRPTLSILARPEEKAWLPTIASGDTHWADTRESLVKSLREMLARRGAECPDADLPRDSRRRALEVVERLLSR